MRAESWSRFAMRRRCRRSLSLALVLLGGAGWLLWVCWPRIIAGECVLGGSCTSYPSIGQAHIAALDLRQKLAEALREKHPAISELVTQEDCRFRLDAGPEGIGYCYGVPGYSARCVTCDVQNGIVFHDGSGGPYGAEVARLNDELRSIVAKVAFEAAAELRAQMTTNVAAGTEEIPVED